MSRQGIVGIVLGVALAGAALMGCSKRAEMPTTAPGADAAMEAPAADDAYAGDVAPDGVAAGADGMDELARLEVELGQNEAVLVGAGVELDAALARPELAAEGAGDQMAVAGKSRCERICDIAKAVCDLDTRICELAERHPGQERYSGACRRAQSDCERATSACDQCSGG